METHELVTPILCSECWHITTFKMHEDSVRGCTYDCKCGRVMRITRDLSTVDLHQEMRRSFAEHVLDTEPDNSKFGYIAIDNVP